VNLPASVKHKRYRQEFRTRFCEGLLARRVLIAEGATEASAMTAVALRLSELNPGAYSSLEALGICTLDAGSETQVADLARLYRELGKEVFAICDKQAPDDEATIRAEVNELFMHAEKGFEDLVLKNTTQTAMERFIDAIGWPPHLASKFPSPKAEPVDALFDYFTWAKGDRSIADFLVSCEEQEIPEWIKQTCIRIKELCEPESRDEDAIEGEEAGGQDGEHHV